MDKRKKEELSDKEIEGVSGGKLMILPEEYAVSLEMEYEKQHPKEEQKTQTPKLTKCAINGCNNTFYPICDSEIYCAVHKMLIQKGKLKV